MSQLVFIHGPGAGACAEGFTHQMDRFPGSFAPNLPGHLSGEPCPDVDRYAEWLRGWLWSQERREDLILIGFTLKTCIALQYALDYPEDAWAAYPDPEVAAHYGEVLWVTGNRDQARIVWQKTLDEHPGDELLLETINRLTNTGSDE